MDNQLPLNKQIGNFLAGEYDSNDVRIQCDAGWYDWFCRDSSLARKTQTLFKKVIQISKTKKFDNKKVYVFFKNNCPMMGRLYDDFRICDLNSGDVLYTVVPRSGHDSMKGSGEVWGKENNFSSPLLQGSWREIKNFFLK